MVVVVFALIYSLLPGAFFHVYYRREPSSLKGADWILDKLNNSFVYDLIEPPITDAYIGSLAATDNGFAFDLELSGKGANGYQFGMTVPMALNVSTPIVMVPPESERYFALLLRQDSDTIDLFPLTAAGFYDESGAVQDILNFLNLGVALGEPDYRKLLDLHAAHSGFPDEVPGGFWRMLYFSVVTITTLGYGDIVPLTNMARLLVGVESALGLTILGLLVSTVLARGEPRRRRRALAPLRLDEE